MATAFFVAVFSFTAATGLIIALAAAAGMPHLASARFQDEAGDGKPRQRQGDKIIKHAGQRVVERHVKVDHIRHMTEDRH